MNLEICVQAIIQHVSDCKLELDVIGRSECSHIGAVFADSILQAGLNYNHVVKPRVLSLMCRFPSGSTTSGFMDLIGRHGAGELLKWRHPEKPERLRGLTNFFYLEGVETTCDLRIWLGLAENVMRLSGLRGIGPKTIDYMQSLVGLPAIAVDRHIRSFAESAGLRSMNYSYLRMVMEVAADRLNCGRQEFDGAVWRYMSTERTARQ